ncbi:MAG TPA: SDR family NAD(P)-dependent oxidoreductase [Candidatus Thermoplasmatota archaeon]|nr:SDR family NAD(P)-dependent oxidoreductase [Candidatus Thermoplasmatota archaeon]
MDLRGKRILVTGGAGFIGSHVVDRLVAEGAKVTVLDNLSGGREAFLQMSRDRITFVQGDCGDAATLDRLLKGIDSVWHLAANPDVRSGESNPDAHYDQNVRVTYALLEGMRRNGVRHLVFTSTSTVYGAAGVIPTPESYGPLLPISVYGACKLACEALISSYAGTFGMQAFLFRFANVVGPRSTHGVIFDFVRRLKADPKRLEILGDGQQTKSYVSVADTVDGMAHAVRHTPPAAGGCHPYNIGSLDAIPVTRLAEVVEEALGVTPEHVFTGGTADGAGWKGDVKRMGLDVTLLSRLGPGWRPKHSSEEAVRITARSLADAVRA